MPSWTSSLALGRCCSSASSLFCPKHNRQIDHCGGIRTTTYTNLGPHEVGLLASERVSRLALEDVLLLQVARLGTVLEELVQLLRLGRSGLEVVRPVDRARAASRGGDDAGCSLGSGGVRLARELLRAGRSARCGGREGRAEVLNVRRGRFDGGLDVRLDSSGGLGSHLLGAGCGLRGGLSNRVGSGLGLVEEGWW